MRRACASLLLLVLMGAIFAPLAHASLTPRSHACCVKQKHSAATSIGQASADRARHACCTLALEGAAAPAAPRLAARPLPAHPIIEEFYPSADSAEPIAHESERAPPAQQ